MLLLLGGVSCMYAQHLDFEAIPKSTKLRVNGGVNANAIYYQASNSQSAGREPFTYMLTGSLNFSFLTFSMPVSYTITNQEKAFNYSVPFNFNRFSITPKYKWVKAYLGDNAMTFSPYTLNGHPFRGVGVELTPKGPLKFAAMGGRLLKAVQPIDSVGLPAVYERYGYGAKIGYEQNKNKVELIGFYATDNEKSIHNFTDISPKTNYVGSIKVGTTLIKNVNIEAEYALSVISEKNKLLYLGNDTLVSYNKSELFTKAFNARINYTIQKTTLGLVYENIDPTYQTFGSLFFNNDLENISLTAARPFFKDKLVVNGQLGYQRDNLKNQKQQTAVRLVGTINASLKVNERFNVAGNYSNFTTTTNRRLNQFDYINMPNLVPADTLNYQQLSQSGNVNINYVLGAEKNQNINFNYSISGQANKQGNVIRKGQASTVQNYNVTHAISFPNSKYVLNNSLNFTTNTIGVLNSTAYGVSSSVSKKFFENKLNSSLGALYNLTSQKPSADAKIFGIRLNAGYILLEKHNLTFSAFQMFRDTAQQKANDLTVNFNYAYNF